MAASALLATSLATGHIVRSLWRGSCEHPAGSRCPKVFAVQALEGYNSHRFPSKSFARSAFNNGSAKLAKTKAILGTVASLEVLSPEDLKASEGRALMTESAEDLSVLKSPIKQCLECQHWKLLVDFKPLKWTADGLDERCRACQALRSAIKARQDLHHLAMSIEEAWEKRKVCTKCGQVKELRDFVRRAASRDGTDCSCRSCKSIQRANTLPDARNDTPQRCTRCEEVKAASEFYYSKQEKGGLHRWCKCCFKSYSKERMQKLPGAEKVLRVEKRCSECGAMKQSNEFYPARHYTDGLQYKCKLCFSALARVRRQQKRE